MTMSFQNLGTVETSRLPAERLQLHYGGWLLASAAQAFVEHRDDDSHSNLGWRPEGGSLITHPLTAADGATLALRLEELALDLGSAGRFSLIGQTVDEALRWLGGKLGRPAGLERREFPDFPASPLADGAAFEAGDAEARVELARWFHDADLLLTGLAEGDANASPVRTWPHHFDTGVLFDEGEGQVVGAGFSPGDHNHDQPYFYVYPYPAPALDAFPALGSTVGGWTDQGFTGGLLTAGQVLGTDDPEVAAAEFLRAAVGGARSVLTRG